MRDDTIFESELGEEEEIEPSMSSIKPIEDREENDEVLVTGSSGSSEEEEEEQQQKPAEVEEDSHDGKTPNNEKVSQGSSSKLPSSSLLSPQKNKVVTKKTTNSNKSKKTIEKTSLFGKGDRIMAGSKVSPNYGRIAVVRRVSQERYYVQFEDGKKGNCIRISCAKNAKGLPSQKPKTKPPSKKSNTHNKSSSQKDKSSKTATPMEVEVEEEEDEDDGKKEKIQTPAKRTSPRDHRRVPKASPPNNDHCKAKTSKIHQTTNTKTLPKKKAKTITKPNRKAGHGVVVTPVKQKQWLFGKVQKARNAQLAEVRGDVKAALQRLCEASAQLIASAAITDENDIDDMMHWVQDQILEETKFAVQARREFHAHRRQQETEELEEE